MVLNVHTIFSELTVSFLQSSRKAKFSSSCRHDYTSLTVMSAITRNMSCVKHGQCWREETDSWCSLLSVSPSAAKTQNGPNVAKNYQHEPFRLTVIANWPMGRCKRVNWPIRGQYCYQLTNEITGNGPSDLGAVKLILLLQRPWQQSLKRNCSDHLEHGASFVNIIRESKNSSLLFKNKSLRKLFVAIWSG